MKIICAYSSVEFQVEHFPYTLSSPDSIHPVFHIPQKKLLAHLGKWAEGGFTPTDSYLYCLALLNSSGLIHWYTSAKRTPFTPAIIAQCIDPLARAVIKLNTVSEPEKFFPSFSITPETCSLQNLPEWIKDWESAYRDMKDGYRSAHDSRKLLNRETALARLIKSPHAPISKIAPQIAEWAAEAGNFPHFSIDNPFLKNSKISLRSYWISLIIKCCRKENIFSLHRPDLEELLTHCEDNSPLGTIYSSHLFQVLRQTIAKSKDFLGLDSLGSYTLLEDNAQKDVESANILALVNAAPLDQPKREDYPSDFKFLQAKLRWDLAKKAGLGKPKEPPEADEVPA